MSSIEELPKREAIPSDELHCAFEHEVARSCHISFFVDDFILHESKWLQLGQHTPDKVPQLIFEES